MQVKIAFTLNSTICTVVIKYVSVDTDNFGLVYNFLYKFMCCCNRNRVLQTMIHRGMTVIKAMLFNIQLYKYADLYLSRKRLSVSLLFEGAEINVLMLRFFVQ